MQYLDDEAIKLCTDVGCATVFYNTVGVYHYRVANGPDNLNTCSVIVNPGERVRLHVYDTFLLTIYREFFASGNFGENDAWKVC